MPYLAEDVVKRNVFKMVKDMRSQLSNFQHIIFTAWKVSKHGVFCAPCFPVFSTNAGKYGPEKSMLFAHFSHSDLYVYSPLLQLICTAFS